MSKKRFSSGTSKRSGVKLHRKLNRSERRFLAAYKHKKYSKR